MVESALTQNKYSLWKQGVCWLLLLGPLFFLSYGQVNQFTATRYDVGSRVFAWEHAIPFMPWTIVPYWSIDLLYGISLFICTSKQELTRHGCRLLASSLIACAGFLLFPLKFTFVRPETQDMFGWLFHQLELFDLPYNQAPSLHIILTWLLWLRFRQHLNRGARMVSGAWFLLIAASVLTTWQHHFVDVLSGFIVAVVISYAIPIEGQWRWKRPSPHALRLYTRWHHLFTGRGADPRQLFFTVACGRSTDGLCGLCGPWHEPIPEKRTRAFISFGPFIALALFNGCKAFKDVVFSPHSQNFRHFRWGIAGLFS